MKKMTKTAISLYVLNKNAKKLRDARKLMKTYLFRHTKFELPYDSNEMMTFLKKEGILEILELVIEDDIIDYSDHDNQEANLEEMVAGWNRWKEEYGKFYDEDADKYVSYKDYKNYIADHPDEDTSWLEDALANMEYYEHNMRNVPEFESKIKKGHGYLASSLAQMNQMYDLKAATIKALNLPVKSYHEFANDDGNYYAFYEFDGFKFHVPVDRDHIDAGDPKIDGTVIDEEISSSMTVNDDAMTIAEAIEVLLETLGFGDDDKARYYDGALASEIANVSLDIVAKKSHMRGNHGETHDYSEDEYYDEYSYDKYNDSYGDYEHRSMDR